jgi:hypothetical protein
MRTTTVIWKYFEVANETNFSDNEHALFEERKTLTNLKLEELGVADNHNIVSNETDNVQNTRTVVRSWPDLETATAWAEFIQTVGAISAQVNPE